MVSKFRLGIGIIGPMAVAISCWMPAHTAKAAETLPALGTDAESTKQYDETVKDAGRPLRWNLNFMKYNQSLNTRMFDSLAQRGVTHIVVTVGLENSLADIARGKIDNDLTQLSADMLQWQRSHPDVQLVVRPFHEMNGDWYPWGFKNKHNGNSIAEFNPAWRHVRSVMRGSFPDLAFMWCANVNQDDNFMAYYPSNDEVEYLAFDGYNHSTSHGGWTTMEQIFDKSLTALRATRGIDRKPLVIAETATTEPDAPSAAAGHSKAEWFGSSHGNMGWWLHNEASKFGVSTVLYFNYPDLYTGTAPSPEAYKNDYLVFDPKLTNASESRTAFRASVHDLP